MKCINAQCQKEIGETMFCPFCGTKQMKPKVFCAYCGAEMDEDAIFCDNCGQKSFIVQQKEKAEQEERQRQAQEAEQRKQEEEQRRMEEREKCLKEQLAAGWTRLDYPDLVFRSLEGIAMSLIVKMDDNYSNQSLIKIPASVRILGVTYPVTSLAEGAFSGNIYLENIVLPNSITEIGEEAFSGCVQLKSVILPDNINEIPARAFKNCSNLTSVDLPESIVDIGDEAFYGSGLLKINIPESVEHIGYEAFNECLHLANIEFRSKQVKVQNTTFDHTPFVKTLEYKSLISSKTIVTVLSSSPNLYRISSEKDNLYGSRDFPYLLFVFSEKTNSFTVTNRDGYDIPFVLVIPRMVSIGNFGYPVVNVIGFESCRSLERLIIPHGEKINIHRRTFAGCDALESVIIDSKSIMIFKDAFDNCTKLKELDFKSEEGPRISMTAFSGCSSLPIKKKLNLVKYHDVKIDLVIFKLDLPSFLKKKE